MNCNEMSEKGMLVLQFCNKLLLWCVVLLAIFAKTLHNTKIRQCQTRTYGFHIGV